MKFLSSIYFNARFFVCASIIILWFCFSFFIPVIFDIGILFCIVLSAFTLTDFLWLYSRPHLIRASRQHANRLSLSDENKIEIVLQNQSNSDYNYEIIDELPVQLQERDFLIKGYIKAKMNKKEIYWLLSDQFVSVCRSHHCQK